MTDEQLARHLQSVGKAAFVTHLDLFRSSLSGEAAADRLAALTGWSPDACRTRVSKARAILAAGRLADALAQIVDAKVNDDVRRAARRVRGAL
jgi:hypothetical protein